MFNDYRSPRAHIIRCLLILTIFFLCGCSGVSAKGINKPDNKTGIANPASVNCKNKGGTLSIQKSIDGGEYGNRLFFTIGNAALASFLEIFLVQTPAFVWVYGWWGAFPVFVTVYIPFFAAACYGHDWHPRTQKLFIGSLFSINAIALIVFGAILKWI
jgi:putative hemolysin